MIPFTNTRNAFTIFGHRGIRSLFPENTIVSFIEAIKMGADAIEMDIVISKDNKVVVSHEAWMNHVICKDPDGNNIEPENERKHNLFEMDYSTIKKYDCGLKTNPEFPYQKRISSYKPLLDDVIKEVEAYIAKKKLKPVKYLIEIKTEEGSSMFNPPAAKFVKQVYQVLEKFNIQSKCVLQSFDVKIMHEIKKQLPKMAMAFLVENHDSFDLNVKRLGFVPPVYSPEFVLVTKELVKRLKALHVDLVPWTVNEPDDMKRMLDYGAVGLITDYPDKAFKLLNA